MKIFTEWMTEKHNKELGSTDLGISTEYDADLVSTQVNDWITKLVGLVHDVPAKQRKSLAEQLAKAVKKRVVEG